MHAWFRHIPLLTLLSLLAVPAISQESCTYSLWGKVIDEQANDPDATFPDISDREQSDFPKIRAFLRALTDPCVTDRACLAPWIPEASEAPLARTAK